MAGAALLCFEDEHRLAAKIAAPAGLALHTIARHRFPDGELKLSLPVPLPERVVLLRSLDLPNEKLVELLLAARTARDLGARRLALVAPYLAYMRQDVAFAPGEAVSQRIVGEFIAGLFDALVTVDPHLHRVARLDQAVPVAQAVALTAAPLLGALAARRRARPLLVGPDAESARWVAAAAAAKGLDHLVCMKIRRGDRDVEVVLPDHARSMLAGRAAVLLDDIASTGHTLAQAARALREAGAASVDVAVTHALFGSGALELLHSAGVDAIWSSDCIAHESNAATIAPLVVEALAGLEMLNGV